jgi:disulfide bond formation protein DsbB
MIESTNFFFGTATLFSVFGFVIMLLLSTQGKFRKQLFLVVNNYQKQIILLLAISAVFSSLWYSIVIGYPPCYLCWWQRIFIYPLVPIMLASMHYRLHDVKWFVLPLAIPGFAISLYQYLAQWGIFSGTAACDLGAKSAGCTSRLVFEYGFITIPFMALFLFTLLLIVTLVPRVQK